CWPTGWRPADTRWTRSGSSSWSPGCVPSPRPRSPETARRRTPGNTKAAGPLPGGPPPSSSVWSAAGPRTGGGRFGVPARRVVLPDQEADVLVLAVPLTRWRVLLEDLVVLAEV